MSRIKDYQVKSNESLRWLIYEHFTRESHGKELPIYGGWGYTQDDAIIIDKNDPNVDKAIPFNGVGMEHFIISRRLEEELVHRYPPGKGYTKIDWNVRQQKCLNIDGRHYDHLVVAVRCMPEEKMPELRQHLDDQDEFFRKMFQYACFYQADYWFDITSFYGI